VLRCARAAKLVAAILRTWLWTAQLTALVTRRCLGRALAAWRLSATAATQHRGAMQGAAAHWYRCTAARTLRAWGACAAVCGAATRAQSTSCLGVEGSPAALGALHRSTPSMLPQSGVGLQMPMQSMQAHSEQREPAVATSMPRLSPAALQPPVDAAQAWNLEASRTTASSSSSRHSHSLCEGVSGQACMPGCDTLGQCRSGRASATSADFSPYEDSSEQCSVCEHSSVLASPTRTDAPKYAAERRPDSRNGTDSPLHSSAGAWTTGVDLSPPQLPIPPGLFPASPEAHPTLPATWPQWVALHSPPSTSPAQIDQDSDAKKRSSMHSCAVETTVALDPVLLNVARSAAHAEAEQAAHPRPFLHAWLGQAQQQLSQKGSMHSEVSSVRSIMIWRLSLHFLCGTVA
jgi:hypothetical protein